MASLSREELHRQFQQQCATLLDSDDRAYLYQLLSEFRTYQSISKLMSGLMSVLSTPEKLDLLKTIRFLIPAKNKLRERFDAAAPYDLMASPLLNTANLDQAVSDKSRIVNITRDDPNEPMGISIRGGRENGLGIFVSSVTKNGLAYRMGLKEGDQLLSVNKQPLLGCTIQQASEALRAQNLALRVSRGEKIPAAVIAHDHFQWKDLEGNQLPATALPDNNERLGKSDMRLLEGQEERKINLVVEQASPLGFSIRGGSEHHLPIFISRVDETSQAALIGLRVGDQVLSVNGENFSGMSHEDAVSIFKSSSELFMTVKSNDRLPSHVITYNDLQWGKVAENEPAKDLVFTKPFLRNASYTGVQPAFGGSFQQSMLRDYMQQVLTKDEQDRLTAALDTYQAGNDSENGVGNLVKTILKTLDTPEKLGSGILREIRGQLRVGDLASFDKAITSKEVDAMKKLKKKGGLKKPLVSQLSAEEEKDRLDKLEWQQYQKQLSQDDEVLNTYL